MPIEYKDPLSGATIYVPTEDEKQKIKNSRVAYQQLESLNKSSSRDRNRSRNSYRRESTKHRVKYTLPDLFNWRDAPISIFTDGFNFFTNFDVELYKNVGGVTYYVSPNGNTANNGLSESTPLPSLLKAYQLSNENDTIILLDGIYRRSAGWQNQRIQKNLNLVAKNRGKVKIVYGDAHTFTKLSGFNNVYETNRSNVSRVVDISFDDSGTEYIEVDSIDICDKNEGSYYTDGEKIYIHTIGHKEPDNDKVFVLLKGEHFYCNSNLRDVCFYIDGVTIYGGNTGNLTVDATEYNICVYGKNTKFLYGSGNGGESDAINVNGATYAFFQNCVAAYSDKDGFNYTAYNNALEKKSSPKFIEVNCKGFGNGLKNKIPGAENTNNGSTAHEGAIGIRVNGEYFYNMGSNVADVQLGTQSLNLGCISYDSACKLDSSFATAFCTQQTGAEMWIDGCIAFGCVYDIYAISGTKMHVYNTEYDTSQGGGTFDIINPL